MKAIGFSGGPDHIAFPAVAPGLSPLFFHDAAAALAIDGEVLFAVEQERLSRQKHTNAFPVEALRACTAFGGLAPGEIDAFAFFFEEAYYDRSLQDDCRKLGLPAPPPVRQLLRERLSATFETEIADEKLFFINHHKAHALSAYRASGLNHALVLVVDGNGEDVSSSLFDARGGDLRLLTNHGAAHSLGHFFRLATKLGGFRDFEEYKFMGLAPYGDAAALQTGMMALFTPLADGGYELDLDGLTALAARHRVGGKSAGMPDRVTADFAAAAQALLERAVQHLLAPWVGRTGARALCLAGGVAQNCVMNARLARTEDFDTVFAYPAAYDAGAAIGAALAVSPPPRPAPCPTATATGAAYSAFLGPELERDAEIAAELERFGLLVEARPIAAPEERAAECLAEGEIIGFAAGRSEFGPRALGARSILADPRPKENWQRINLAIKQRESFRPFAPAALAEEATALFDTPDAALNLDHMTFVSRVRPVHQAQLGAVTHVDGSARLQTVAASSNPALYSLISAFKARTGCPVLLNTSFNNSHEPIVQSARDALRTFLTTELDCLFVGGFEVRKAGALIDHLPALRWRLDPWVEITKEDAEQVTLTRAGRYRTTLPAPLFAMLLEPEENGARGSQSPRQADQDQHQIADAVATLWRQRFIDVHHAC
ncbi:carbamoyltransferase family protein [Stappia indica]|uniref:carbamoyltransferase family protein n=1 Tax=Stappia indica TaxID=538381 RepID=UPI001CD2A918|nr:carbamoyltransferase C-terminal domain-containing protein [Stappia indica]MCA1298561.1 nodulation protein [Stappia indica]